MKAFRAALRYLLDGKFKTQAALAKEIGKSQQTISKLKLGLLPGTYEKWEQIANAFGFASAEQFRLYGIAVLEGKEPGAPEFFNPDSESKGDDDMQDFSGKDVLTKLVGQALNDLGAIKQSISNIEKRLDALELSLIHI